MPINLATLKEELALPAYAEAIALGWNEGIAAMLNAVDQAININRASVTTDEIIDAIAPADFAALTQLPLLRLSIILQKENFSVKGGNARQSLLDIFPAGATATRTALAALRQRKGSRAEELFGVDVKVTSNDVAAALVS